VCDLGSEYRAKFVPLDEVMVRGNLFIGEVPAGAMQFFLQRVAYNDLKSKESDVEVLKSEWQITHKLLGCGDCKARQLYGIGNGLPLVDQVITMGDGFILNIVCPVAIAAAYAQAYQNGQSQIYGSEHITVFEDNAACM